MRLVHVTDIADWELIQKRVEEGLITARPHDQYPLTIYNYSKECMITQAWDEATTMCRGLIVDDKGIVVARPFPKFFNFGETAVPEYVKNGQPAQIFEKMDGSLGILYYYRGWNVATRGSFHSPQAEWATGWIQTAMQQDPEFEHIATNYAGKITPLVEIVYPANRIVVNYGDRAGLTFLGAIEHSNGADVDRYWDFWPWDKARRFADTEIQDINHMVHGPDHEGDEGVVMVWPKPNQPSFRLKVKRADYVEMHRIMFGMTARKVWESIINGVSLQAILESGMPEEFNAWVENKWNELHDKVDEIIATAEKHYRGIMMTPDISRRQFAEKAKRHDNPGLLFALLDGKDIRGRVWQMVYPPHEVPFAEEGDPNE